MQMCIWLIRTNTVSDDRHFSITPFNFFKVFAWCDYREFEIHCTIDAREKEKRRAKNKYF
jgi:hypothetical protein